MNVIEISGLKKVFSSKNGPVFAVNGINFTVTKGEIFGLLGPNGAGKTTTMRMLTTLLKPTSGSAFIAGYDLQNQSDMIRTHIGYVSQKGGLERNATARENLVLQARIYGMSALQAQDRAQQLISALDLASFSDRLVETYSGGQRRRVDIALGMVHSPAILFLDEPTIGLDPRSRAHIWQEIKKLKSYGTTILFTTHYLDEADMFCDRVAIINHGQVVALGTPKDLKSEISDGSQECTPSLDDVFLQKTGHSFKNDEL
jgi:ABC-2 type transport system ATP-binding protein